MYFDLSKYNKDKNKCEELLQNTLQEKLDKEKQGHQQSVNKFEKVKFDCTRFFLQGIVI